MVSRGPYKVGALAEAVAVGVLRRDSGWVRERTAEVRELRDAFAARLAAAGFDVMASSANFVAVLVDDAQRIFEAMLDRGVLVRAYRGLPVFGDLVRITIGPQPLLDQARRARGGRPVRIAIHDDGAGNVHSLARVLGTAGDVLHTADVAELCVADLIVLPGVGAFDQAMARLGASARRLADAIADGTPCLAICLGAQVLFESSEEGELAGLGVLEGRVRRLRAARLPHIGWEAVTEVAEPVLAGSGLAWAYDARQLRVPHGRVPLGHVDLARRGRGVPCDHPRGAHARRPVPPREELVAGRRDGACVPRGAGRVIVVPAIDLRDGACVQLRGGSYDDELLRIEDPLGVAARWRGAGFTTLHVVDLDAATGRGSNATVVSAICAMDGVRVQAGGGVRDEADVDRLVAAGAWSVVVATRAIEDPDWLVAIAEARPERISVAVDVRAGVVTTEGWARQTDLGPLEFVGGLAALPLCQVLATAVDVEGTQGGPDLALVAALRAATRHRLGVAGGIAQAGELHELARPRRRRCRRRDRAVHRSPRSSGPEQGAAPMTTVRRTTTETDVTVVLAVAAGPPTVAVATTDEFLDHMVATLARYAGLDCDVRASSDLHHHLVEDVAITLGRAIAELTPAAVLATAPPRSRWTTRSSPPRSTWAGAGSGAARCPTRRTTTCCAASPPRLARRCTSSSCAARTHTT